VTAAIVTLKLVAMLLCYYVMDYRRSHIIHVHTHTHNNQMLHKSSRDSQNHRIPGWLRLEGTSGGNLVHPPAQAGTPTASCPGLVQTVFEYLQGGTLHHLSGQPVSVLGHPHSKKVFPDAQREPPVLRFVPIASGPVIGHYW